MSPSLTSAAFAHQGAIPTKYTCEGADVSPPLTWGELPPATKSLALIHHERRSRFELLRL
jgi:phosphatidylethanolamine-binding protein (PEBP) family uncharacterized protein